MGFTNLPPESNQLLDKRLVLILGKGGVGRSTVAAATASACAAKGRRTLLFQSTSQDRIGNIFSQPAIGTAIQPLAENLFAVNTTPKAALKEYGMMVLRFQSIYKLVFENRISKHFLHAVPGVQDYSIIGKAWYHTTETKNDKPVWDTVVFDMPASGHSLSMLRIAWTIIQTIPRSPLTKSANSMVDLLRDPQKTSIMLVTLAEEMAAREALDLHQGLNKHLDLAIHHLFINQVYPDYFPLHSPASDILDKLIRSQLPTSVASVTTHADLLRERKRLHEQYIRELRDSLCVSQSQLPYLFSPKIGLRELQTLSQQIAKQIG